MVVAVWSVKGGVGVTSVAGLLAIGRAERAAETLLIDLCGDVPMLLGCDAPAEPGIAEWAAMANPTSDALDRIAVPAQQWLRFVARGQASLPDLAALRSLSVGDSGGVIVDCGLVRSATTERGAVVAHADHSLLVARECYLTLRAVQASPLTPSGVVVIKEPHRRLGRPDVESAAGAPVVAEIAVDRAITDALDAGLVSARLPRSLVRTMSKALDRVALDRVA